MPQQVSKTVLVTGATGHQGGAVARLLQKKGHQVRALVRRADSAAAIRLREHGAQIAEGSLEDRAALDSALEGVEAFYGVTTPFEAGMDAEIRQGKTLVDAAAAARVPLVFSSVGWAWAKTGIPHFDSKWEIEEHLRAVNTPHTIIGPAFFMDNLTAPSSLPAMRQQGVVAIPMSADVRQAMIPVENIADFAVYAIENPDKLVGKRVDIASDILTGPEIARLISEAAGREFGFYEVPKDVVETEDLRKMFNWYESSRPTVDVEALRKEYPEIPWLTFRQWAAKQDWQSLLNPQVTGE